MNHFGFQVESKEEVVVHKERLEKEGLIAREEMNITCCYAVQDKFWVTEQKNILFLMYLISVSFPLLLKL